MVSMKTNNQNAQSTADTQTRKITGSALSHPRTAAAFRTTRRLVGCYLGLSVLTLVATFLLRNHHSEVNSTVWIRGGIVAATAVLMFAFATRAAHGSRDGYRRVRIMSAIMVVAIAVIISLPGFIPVWMKIEQGACGLLLIGVVAVVNGKHLRSLFGTK
jgi:chromate transport protein ChrA